MIDRVTSLIASVSSPPPLALPLTKFFPPTHRNILHFTFF